MRTGVWWEHSSSQRERSDFDATQCFASANCNPWHDQQLRRRQHTGGHPTSAPARGGFFEYIEHSGWDQYQPFVELEMKPTRRSHHHAGLQICLVEPLCERAAGAEDQAGVQVAKSFTTTRDLPFLMVNYKIQPSWSVYAQYAQGIYVPDISAFEQSSRTTAFPKAQTTTNYQVGTVYYADNWTFDGDIYYIGVNNNISFQSCTSPPFTGPSGETCALNTGVATYKGIEGEGTYAFNGDLEGLAVFLNGSLNSSKSGGKWLKQAPMWTSAGGIFYKRDIWKVSLIDKVVGQQ